MHWMLSTLYVCSILPGAGGRGFSSSYSIYLSNRDIDKFWCNLSSTAGWNRGRILTLSVLAWCSPGFFSLFTIKTSSLCMQECATLLTLPRVLESILCPCYSFLFMWPILFLHYCFYEHRIQQHIILNALPLWIHFLSL